MANVNRRRHSLRRKRRAILLVLVASFAVSVTACAFLLYDANGAVLSEAVEEGGHDFSLIASTPKGDVFYNNDDGGRHRFVELDARGTRLGSA